MHDDFCIRAASTRCEGDNCRLVPPSMRWVHDDLCPVGTPIRCWEAKNVQINDQHVQVRRRPNCSSLFGAHASSSNGYGFANCRLLQTKAKLLDLTLFPSCFQHALHLDLIVFLESVLTNLIHKPACRNQVRDFNRPIHVTQLTYTSNRRAVVNRSSQSSRSPDDTGKSLPCFKNGCDYRGHAMSLVL